MTILFYVETIFPNGAAWSVRANSFVKILKQLNHNIHIVSLYKSPDYVEKINNHFDGEVTIEFVKKKNPSRYDNLWINRRAYKIIKKYLKENKVDTVFTTRAPQIFKKLLKYTKKRGLSYFVEQCELFNPETFIFGKLNPYYITFSRLVKNDYKNATGIIAISRYLEEFYKKQEAKVIRIPTIIDTKIFTPNYDISFKEVRLVFAGNIRGKKELLKPLIIALIEFNRKSHKKIIFDILGPSKKDILENIDGEYQLLEKAENIIHIHGKVPQNHVYTFLAMSHFLIFIRPDRKSSNAGFPTKISESLSMGTPVITNLTSDINLYIKNDYNGFLLKDTDTQSLIKIFNTIIKLSEKEIILLRRNARKTAEDFFDYRNYINDLGAFLSLKSNDL